MPTKRIKDLKKVIFGFASLKNQFDQLYLTKLAQTEAWERTTIQCDKNGNVTKVPNLLDVPTLLMGYFLEI